MRIAPFFVVAALAAHSAQAAVTVFSSKTDFDSAVTTSLVEDFEGADLTRNVKLPSFTHNGITFIGNAGAPSKNVVVLGPGFNNFGAGVPHPTTTTLLTANGDEDFSGIFATPVRAVGFDAYFNGLGPVSVDLVGTKGLIQHIVVTPAQGPQPNGVGYLGFLSTTPITQFRWKSTDGGELNTGIDNISTAPVLVPEPGTWASAMVGMVLAGGVLGLRRRRTR